MNLKKINAEQIQISVLEIKRQNISRLYNHNWQTRLLKSIEEED